METEASCDVLLGVFSNIYANPEIPTVIQTPMIVKVLFLGRFVDASNFLEGSLEGQYRSEVQATYISCPRP